MSAPPQFSDLNLFCNGQRIVDFNTQISNSAFDLGMTEQNLDGPQITGFAINKRRLRSAQRVRAKLQRIEIRQRNPVRDRAQGEFPGWLLLRRRSICNGLSLCPVPDASCAKVNAALITVLQ